MTDKPISQEKYVCGHCHAEIDAGDLWEPTTTPLDLTYRERAPCCPECDGEMFRLPKGDKPTD